MQIDFHDSLVQYHNHGVQFDYPDIWEISEVRDDDDVIITVSMSETCFWTLRLLPACPPPPQVVESCVEAFKDEYEEVDVESVSAKLAEMPAVASHLSFFCLEMLNSVGLQSVRTSDFTLLLWWQGVQHELAETEPIFEHMTRSVRADTLFG